MTVVVLSAINGAAGAAVAGGEWPTGVAIFAAVMAYACLRTRYLRLP